jgi:branched-chain amino acid transport system permease protein
MAVVLGGMGSTPGVILGAVFISLLPELLRDLADYRFFAFGVLLIVVMLVRPQGLWPHRSTESGRTAARTSANDQAGPPAEPATDSKGAS